MSDDSDSVQGDVGSKHGIDEVVTKVKSLGKGVDTLITAAGIRRLNKKSFTPGQGLAALVESTNSLDWQDLDDSFHINVFSQYYLTAGLLDLLGASAAKHPGRGSVICFSSVASKHTAQFLPAYQASKAAVDHLAKIMAAEFADLYSKYHCPWDAFLNCSIHNN